MAPDPALKPAWIDPGGLKTKPDLTGIYSLQELNAVLASRGLASVAGP